MRLSWIAVVLPALGSIGCAGAGMVAARASAELHCPEKDITVHSREMGAYTAEGCGKHASYVLRAGEVMPDPGAHEDLPDSMPKMPKDLE